MADNPDQKKNQGQNDWASPEQKLVIRDYLEGLRKENADQLKLLRKRFLDLHNRFPSKEEEALYMKRQKGGTDERLQEQPLEESHPEDYIPGTAILKGVGTAAVGAASLAHMLMRKGTVSTAAKTLGKKEAGWIGSRVSDMPDVVKQAAGEAAKMELAKQSPKDIYDKTGWFQLIPGERRYLDLDFVDDLAANAGKETKGDIWGLFHKIQGESFARHTKNPPKIVGLNERERALAGKSENWQGTYIRDINRVQARQESLKEDLWGVIPHEGQHAIQNYSRTPGGSSPSHILDNYVMDVSGMEGESLGRDSALSIYRHNAGEVEARLNQYYHTIAAAKLRNGNSPAEVKEYLRTQDPWQVLKRKEPNLRYEDIWRDETDLLKKFNIKKVGTGTQTTSEARKEALPASLRRQSGDGYPQLQKQTDTIPEMLRRQSGLEVDPNYVPKELPINKEAFSIEPKKKKQ